jgi:HAD superfamily hydrolase (TIGR01509 family)
MLKALLWDVDGTIAETERDGHQVAFNLAFAEAGLAWVWGDAHYSELLHVTGGRERILADMAGRSDAPRAEAARDALARRLHARKNHWYARRVDEGLIEARSQVIAVIREAAEAGLRQAIVTTTSRANVEALLPRLLGTAWHELFAAVLCGEETLRKKPDPEVYQLALLRLGLRGDDALAIEDSTPGARAANAAGVPLLLRPSAYFPAQALPPDLGAARLCGQGDDFSLSALRGWHTEMARPGILS